MVGFDYVGEVDKRSSKIQKAKTRGHLIGTFIHLTIYLTSPFCYIFVIVIFVKILKYEKYEKILHYLVKKWSKFILLGT